MTLTDEKRFAILISILDVGGVGTKKQVLDNIERCTYVRFTQKDLEYKSNRKELYWRNDLAFIRKGLADRGFIDDSTRDAWKITEEGTDFLDELCEKVLSDFVRLHKLTETSINRAQIRLSSVEKVNKRVLFEWEEDGETIHENVSVRSAVQRIRRYQKIVKELKEKYKNRCQLEGCGFTFLKQDGGKYSEAHHLIPLSQGGTQDKNNVVILCPNHHRMFHYADVVIGQRAGSVCPITLNGVRENIAY